MKLKLGNLILNQRAPVKLFLIFFLFGVLIGVKITIREQGKSMSLIPFMPVYVIIIPALCRGIKKDIDSERL